MIIPWQRYDIFIIFKIVAFLFSLKEFMESYERIKIIVGTKTNKGKCYNLLEEHNC